MYHCPDGQQGFPAVAFKAAAVDACSHVADITKVTARGAFHIIGDMIPLQYESVTMQQDMVRIGMGTADVRIRPRYDGWSVTFDLRYNANVISLEQLALLFDTAGFSIGVGEWRPQKDGSYGMFECASVAPLAD